MVEIIVCVLSGLLGVLVILLGICCVRAVAVKNRKPYAAAPPVDGARSKKAAEALSDMIKAQTVNAPDADPEVVRGEFEKHRKALEAHFPLTHKVCERTLINDAMLLHWKSKHPERAAVVLMAHSDVVPATGRWQYPPFSGEIADGAVRGRGAVDTKGSLCAIFQAVEELLAEGFEPPCDIYIESSDNEEISGPGAPSMRDELTKRGVKLRLVLDEGGAVVTSPLPGLNGYYAMLGIVEKGFANVRFTARSAGGHASAPPRNSPFARLAAFICEMEKRPPFKRQISPPMRRMISALAPDMGFPMRLIMSNLWLFSPLIKAVVPRLSPVASAMLSTTCAFTMSEGSQAANVLPETASVTANMRFIMHQTMVPSIEAVKKAAAKYGLETEVLYAHDCSSIVDTGSDEYRFVSRLAGELFPDAGQSPYIMVGGTDARHFSEVCPAVIRFSPLMVNKPQLDSIHGLDENIDVTALGRAAGFYRRLIEGLADIC
uniref:Peptidase M20 n=1 Tax=uncultured bacterium contig00034 TaxID=1181523 RepID=A0A806JYT4_9BACT|nr:peptidase M20 [uncultured bacterium contig00034]